jgi:signal transduction histidine kinase
VAERRIEAREGHRCAVFVVAEEASVQAAYDRERGPLFYEKRGGMGMALPLAQRVIEGHGGQIWSPLADVEDDPLERRSIVVALPIV